MTIESLKSLKNANGIGDTIKFSVGLAIGFAADLAITALLKGHVPPGKGMIKLLTKLGIFAIGMKVGEDIENYFYKVCDDTKQAFDEAKEEAKKAVDEIVAAEKDPGGH